jgi:peptidoglycan hydrolase-like protein with peptidoglycan-binding domain
MPAARHYREEKPMPRSLAYGCTGQDVRQLQKLLNFHLPFLPRWRPLVADGVFGPKTRERVIDFQRLSSEQLAPDGIVGPLSRRALLLSHDFRTQVKLRPKPPATATTTSSTAKTQPAGLGATPPVSTTTTSSTAKTQPANPVSQRSVSVQVGRQANYSPTYNQPLVLNVQHNWLFRAVELGGPPVDFTLSAGGQVALNQQCPPLYPPNVARLDNKTAEDYRRLRFSRSDCPEPVGSWSGQGFVNFGPGGFLKGLDGSLDLMNPAVNLMLQKNEAQPLGLGVGFSNQTNLTLWSEKDRGNPDNDLYNLSLFVNTAVVWNVDLSNPKSFNLLAPGWQVLSGINFTFDVSPEKPKE